MPFRFLTLILVFSAALLSPAAAGGKPNKKASVFFHIQGDATENPRMIFAQEMNGKTMNFRRVPEVGTKDVASYTPFPAAGGGNYGAVFRHKRNTASRLSAISNASHTPSHSVSDARPGPLRPGTCESKFLAASNLRVVGFDDVRFATVLSVPLTTIQQPCRDIALTAFNAMRERIADPTLPARSLLITPRLVVRESCGAYLPC